MDETNEPTPGHEQSPASNVPGGGAGAVTDPRIWGPPPETGVPGVVGPSVAAQPTAQIPAQPTQQVPVQPSEQIWGQPGQPVSGPPGWAAFGATPPPTGATPPPTGATPPGQPPTGGTPPYAAPGFGGHGPYQGGQGYWGQTPWPGSAPTWGWTAPSQAGPRRANAPLLTAIVVAAVVIAAVAGVVIGHAVWSNTSLNSQGSGSPITTPGSGTSPFGSGNSGGTNPFGSGNSGSGQGSSASGAPADASSIANNVDPGLVDVNTTLSYQGLQGAGTGMVLTPDGEILTNNHVIEGETSISVTDIGNGKTYNANVVGYDRTEDVAVIQLVGASGLQTVSTGDSSKVKVGEGVVAIGNANGAGGTPSYAGGSVTATNQSITASDEADGTSEQLTGLIETNADIIEGDSGGPLVDSSGQVIGMDTAGSGGSGGFQFQSPSNQGYSIPINNALSTARQIESGSASSDVHLGSTAFLGVEVADSSAGCPSSSPFGGLGGSGSSGSTPGAYVCDAVPGDPAAQAGMTAGDTITSMDGHSVTSAESLTDVMLGETPGHSVPVQYVDTSGQQQTANVTLGTGPPQ